MRIYAAKAAEILYLRYLEFKNITPQEICKCTNGIFMQSNDLMPGAGICLLNRNPSIYLIAVSVFDTKLKSDFIAYHELAHCFLLREHIPAPLGNEEYWVVEAWCDNFTLAMMLACFGVDIMPRDNLPEFFNIGAELTDGNAIDAAIVKRLKKYLEGREISPELEEFCNTFQKISSK